jgi:hypothetical protein
LAGLIGAASAFLYWLVIAHRGSQIMMGRASTIVLAGSLINAVTSFGLNVGIMRLKATDQTGRSSLLFALGMSALASVVLALFVGVGWDSNWLLRGHLTNGALTSWLILLSCGLALTTLLDVIAVGFGAPLLALGRNVVVFVIRFAMSVTGPAPTPATMVRGFVLPIVVSAVLFLVLFFWRTRRTLPWRVTTSATEFMVRTSFRSWPASLVFNIVALGVPLTVSIEAGPAAGAVFYLLWNVSTLANSVTGAITSLGVGEQHDVPTRRVWLLTSLVAIAGALGGEIALLAFGWSYFTAGRLAAILLGVALLPYGLVQFRVMKLRRQGHHHGATVSTMVLLLCAEIPLFISHNNSLVLASSVWLLASVASLLAAR